MKRALHFATKIYSRDIQNCRCVSVLSYRKAVFPALTATGVQIEKHVIVSGSSNLPQKSSTVLSEPKFGSPNQKFLDPPLKRVVKWWHTKVIVWDPERSCSSNKPVGGAENKQTDVLRNKPEKTADVSRRHHLFDREMTCGTLKCSNSIHTDDAQLTTQIWTVLLIG